jgi:hypothetical protein
MKQRQIVNFGVRAYLGFQTATFGAHALSTPQQPDVDVFEAPIISTRQYPRPFLQLPDLDSTSTITMVNSLVHSSSS